MLNKQKPRPYGTGFLLFDLIRFGCVTQMFDEPAFFAGGGIFVNDAFCHSGIEFDLCLTNLIGRVGCAVVNGCACAFHDRARFGFDQAVALATPRVFANVFLGGSSVCQLKFLRICLTELRHAILLESE